jgi:catalase-peroxidase
MFNHLVAVADGLLEYAQLDPSLYSLRPELSVRLSVAVAVTGTESPVVMNTADIALLKDPEYLKYVNLFATDLDALGKAFAAAWYKLVTRDMGPVTRCLGPDVPPAQPFQNPLPLPPSAQANFTQVRADIVEALTEPSTSLEGDKVAMRSF